MLFRFLEMAHGSSKSPVVKWFRTNGNGMDIELTSYSASVPRTGRSAVETDSRVARRWGTVSSAERAGRKAVPGGRSGGGV